ncbi:MAG: ABC transporter ATP-binding protein [Coriobacteriales bacterium]|nr:ABC transporter ATP-binding protein [Coriobacteriales bacterium]
MSGIVVENLQYTYPHAKQPTLKGVSFTAETGELTALIGANAVGKSTMLKVILGLRQGQGTVTFSVPEIGDLNKEARLKHISYMTQSELTESELRVMDVVLLGRIQTLSLKVADEDLEKAWETMRVLRIDNLATRPVRALSGGQRRMVSIAQTLVKDPTILVMDEPTANLDMQHELEVLQLVRAYTHQRKTASLLTLHDLNMASRFADKLVLLKDGKVFATGTPGEVITEENIRNAYGVEVSIHLAHDGIPILNPLRSLTEQNYHFAL